MAIGSLSLSNNIYAGEALSEWYANQVEQKQNRRDGESRGDGGGEQSGERKTASVPELDSAGAPIALALIAGIAGIALERRRSKKTNS